MLMQRCHGARKPDDTHESVVFSAWVLEIRISLSIQLAACPGKEHEIIGTQLRRRQVGVLLFCSGTRLLLVYQ